MNHVRRIAAAAAALMCLAFSACAQDFADAGFLADGTAQQLGAPKDYGSERVTVDVPGENPVIEGINPITGEPYAGEYTLTLVNIDTHPRALPHWGVSSADLIYEMPIQAAGDTRSVALFMGEYPAYAGPVRSARVPMASLREMWGGMYCFYGYQGGRDTNNVKNWVIANSEKRKFSMPYIDLMGKRWSERSREYGHVAPYNVRLDMAQALENHDADAQPHPFLFSETGLTQGESVNGMVISYKQTNPAYVAGYRYNEETGLFDRYRNGEPYIDANNGEICSFANVIVLRTDISWASNNPSRPVIRLHGEGVCEIFQNGRYIRGTWARESTATKNLDSRMVFLDENGQEVPMKAGKTFIQIVDNEQPVVVFSDEKIAGSIEPQPQRKTVGAPIQTKRPKATATPEMTEEPTPEPTATPEATEAPTPEPTPTPEATEAPEKTEPPVEEITPAPQEPDTPGAGEASPSEATVG